MALVPEALVNLRVVVNKLVPVALVNARLVMVELGVFSEEVEVKPAMVRAPELDN